MSRPSLRVCNWLLAACSARTSELIRVCLVISLVGVADLRLARQQLMSSPKPVGFTSARETQRGLECGCPLPLSLRARGTDLITSVWIAVPVVNQCVALTPPILVPNNPRRGHCLRKDRPPCEYR